MPQSKQCRQQPEPVDLAEGLTGQDFLDEGLGLFFPSPYAWILTVLSLWALRGWSLTDAMSDEESHASRPFSLLPLSSLSSITHRHVTFSFANLGVFSIALKISFQLLHSSHSN